MSHVPEKPAAKIPTHRDVRDLQQLRDELALELHLMNMEMKTRWHALEKKFEHVRNDAKLQAGTLARQYADELKADYKKLREELREGLHVIL